MGEVHLSGLPLPLALPFVGLLGCIALFPLVAPHFWERHMGKIVAGAIACVLLPLLLYFGPERTSAALAHTVLLDYVPFILLLLALFTVAGGIVVKGNLHGTPLVNTSLLATGAAMASLIGTTGAAMVMIRPLLRANDDRKHNAHTVIFFIFLVCNVGGSLTPLGDPPLFLGFLRGVDFFWTTTNMLAPTLFSSALLLAVFFILDRSYYRREGHLPADPTPDTPVSVDGVANVLLIGVVISAILLSATVDLGSVHVLGAELPLAGLVRDGTMLLVTFLSIFLTGSSQRQANGFSWAPIREVAILFAGLFVTIIPVLAMLHEGAAGPFGPLLTPLFGADGSPNNLAFFWVTGALSSFLDNAPTYLVFFELAGGDPQRLMTSLSTTLVAISAGAVFMGAFTYIGNAPNFMVYAIARGAGVRMPGFFGYIKWSAAILLPTFTLMSLLFIGAR